MWIASVRVRSTAQYDYDIVLGHEVYTVSDTSDSLDAYLVDTQSAPDSTVTHLSAPSFHPPQPLTPGSPKLQSMPDLAKQVTDLESSLIRTQSRLEAQTQTSRTLRLSAAAESKLRARCDDELATLSHAHAILRAQNATFEAELAQLRSLVQSSGTPEAAELVGVRQELMVLRKEREGLAKSLASVRADFEFTRGQYQIASGAAAESAGRVLELETENRGLRVRAESRAVEFRAMNEDRRVLELEGKVGVLRAEKEVREWEAGAWAKKVVGLGDEVRRLREEIGRREEQRVMGGAGGFGPGGRFELEEGEDGQVFLRMMGPGSGDDSVSEESSEDEEDEEERGHVIDIRSGGEEAVHQRTRESTTNPIQQPTADLGLQ